MRREVPDADAIHKATQQLLLKAEAKDRLPTPVDDILAAAGLAEPEHSLLSNFVLEQAPAHLQAPIRKLRLKVRAVLDRKTREVHIDPTIQLQGRAAFKKLHEVTHDILPWQRDLGYADDDETLSQSTKRIFEWQANHGAAELLFQGSLFREMAAQYQIGMAAILELAEQIGASGHATFRRFAETHRSALAGIVLEQSPCSRDPLAYRREEVVCSPSWEKRFGTAYTWPHVLSAIPYSFVEHAPKAQQDRTVASAHFKLPDLRHDQVALNVEIYSNSYKLFVLLWIPRTERLRRKRIIVPGAA